MAAAPRYARANYNRNYGTPLPYRFLPEIENFCISVQPLLAAAFAVDPGTLLNSTQSLLETLFWFGNVIFTDATNPNNLPIGPPTAAQAQSLQNATAAVVNLNQAVTAINNLVPQPNNASLDAPGESPLESALQTIVQATNPASFDNAWTLLQQNVAGGILPNGMPALSILCSGTVGGAQTYVVATNDSKWDTVDTRPGGLNRWCRQARDNTMTLAYRTNVGQLHTAVVNNLPALQAAFDGAAPGAKDAAVVAAWDIAMPPPPPNHYARALVLSAMPFTPRWPNGNVPVARCRRCRVVYRYNMGTAAVVEPELYNLGPYQNATSCAEVGAYVKCGRYNL